MILIKQWGWVGVMIVVIVMISWYVIGYNAVIGEGHSDRSVLICFDSKHYLTKIWQINNWKIIERVKNYLFGHMVRFWSTFSSTFVPIAKRNSKFSIAGTRLAFQCIFQFWKHFLMIPDWCCMERMQQTCIFHRLHWMLTVVQPCIIVMSKMNFSGVILQISCLKAHKVIPYH